MKRHLLGCALLLALGACASHPPRCGGRLTPINRRLIPAEVKSASRPAGRGAKAGRS